MIVNGKIALNPYETDIRFMELVDIGDDIVANEHGEEFNLSPGSKYKLLGCDGDCVKVENDLGIENFYAVDYFRKA